MKRVITIGREFGSGGRELGRRIAEKLGIAYYDQEIITEITKRTALSEEYIRQIEEMRPILHFPIRTGHRFYLTSEPIFYPDLSIYTKQHELLRELSRKSNCVIVGRCADYVLEGHPGLVSLFVSAPMEARVARVMRRNNLSECDARSRIARVDKNRASYYRYFTDENWGQARNYDLCINSGNLDALGAVSVIKTFVEARQS